MPKMYNYGKRIFDQISMALNPGFNAKTLSSFSYRPIQVESIVPESKMAFPLKLVFAKTFVKDNIVLLGY